ncbi:AMP-binding protein [Roseovarius salis]|uniref:malonate--CoA ligase n=1 Tax=Roseovarius salis TaxID=3376063 RepID=UPI0037CBD706
MANPLYDSLFGKHAGKSTPFLYTADGGCLSHAAFLEVAGRFANALADAGLAPGDRLAAQVAKSPEALALYAACVQAGVIFLPLNTAYTVDELAYFIDNSGAAMVVCDGAAKDALAPVAAAHDARLETLNADGSGTLADRARPLPGDFDTVPREQDDLAALLYTSGTTGRSKGAMLTQRNLLSNAEVLTDYWRFTADDVLLHALPIFHTHGLFVATNIMLLAGGAMIFLPRFDVDAMIARMPDATSLMGVPTFYTRLLDDPRFTRELAAHMRLFVSGSAPLLEETHRRFEARTGHRILERYGMTETNMSTSNPYDGERRAGTVGFPLPGVELKITDPETGAERALGETGMIEVRGPNVFKGYWQMPEKTAEELRADGFFITGDLGRVDADGYVQIVGREKDLIISGGLNVYPKEVEQVLDAQPGVLESAVVGVPHDDLGEGVLALVVPAAGAAPEPDALAAATAQQLARFKQPRKILLVDSLPRNTMGKVQKSVLREDHAAALRGD